MSTDQINMSVTILNISYVQNNEQMNINHATQVLLLTNSIQSFAIFVLQMKEVLQECYPDLSEMHL